MHSGREKKDLPARAGEIPATAFIKGSALIVNGRVIGPRGASFISRFFKFLLGLYGPPWAVAKVCALERDGPACA